MPRGALSLRSWQSDGWRRRRCSLREEVCLVRCMLAVAPSSCVSVHTRAAASTFICLLILLVAI